MPDNEQCPFEQIRDELSRAFRGLPDMCEALQLAGIVPEHMSLSHITAQHGWTRGGWETYALPFSVHMTDKNGTEKVEQKLLFKACTPLPGPIPLLKVFDSWLARRKLLETRGVSTPKLCKAYKAVVLEEFVEYHLSDAIMRMNDRLPILNELGRSVGIVAQLGFRPPGNIISDVRSRGRDVVFIDFGYDLGPSKLPPDEKIVVNIMEETVASLMLWPISFTEAEIDCFRAGFLRSTGRLS